MQTPVHFSAAGHVRSAELVEDSPFKAVKTHWTTARRAGLVYEQKVVAKIRELFTDGAAVLAGPWFKFVNSSGLHWCQMDCVVRLEKFAVVFESKAQHTEDAWWQLHQLYAPVLKAAWKLPVACVEVTKSYDPAVNWPEDSPKVVFDLLEMREELMILPYDRTLIVQWKPRRQTKAERSEWLERL